MAQAALSIDTVRADVAVGGRERRSALASPRALISLPAALLVCALVVLAVHSLQGSQPVPVLWGATGVAVAGWLNGPRGREFEVAYGLLVAAAFAIGGLLVGQDLARTLLNTGACMIETTSALWMIRRLQATSRTQTLEGLLKFLAIVPVVAPLLSGLAAAAGVCALGKCDFLDVLLTWQLGHGLGLAVVGPLGLRIARGGLARHLTPVKLIEGACLLGAVGIASVLVFFAPAQPAGFMLMPLLLLAAARLRLTGASLALVIISAAGILRAMQGAPALEAERVRLMQLFLIFSALPALPVAALLDERDRLAGAARAGQTAAEKASAGKSRLLANVSHEIKSPVAGIIGIGELWSAGRLGPVTPMQHEMAEMLVRTARQVEALAYDLLDVSQAEAGAIVVRLGPVEVGALLEDLARTLALKPEAEGIEIRVEQEQEDLRAMADSVRLTQVLTNLASNAVKYGGSGGLVLLRVERQPLDRVRILIADKGPGIASAKQAELFEPFNRLGMEKSTVEGNGIGLALARRLTELQGGTIGFESESGNGACFWVDLPAA